MGSSVRRGFGRVVVVLVMAAAVIPHPGRGASWRAVNAGLPGIQLGINSLAIDPASPSVLYAVAVNNSAGGAVVRGLFKTTDGGGTWREVGSIAGVECLTIAPSTSSTLYAGTDHGVATSADAGASWRDVSSGLPAGAVTRLVMDPATPSTLYAVTSTAPTATPGGPIASSIYKTTDGGASWNVLNTGLPTSAYITLLVIDPTTPTTLYTFAPAFDPTGTGAPQVGGLLKSVDGGQSWMPLNDGLPLNTFLNALAIDPTTSTLYATGSRGLLKSADGGETWDALDSLQLNINLVVIDPADPTSIYAVSTLFGPGGQSWNILKSTNGGKSWTTIDPGLPPNGAIDSLVLDPSAPSRIYIGIAGNPFPPAFGAPGKPVGGVYKSSDGGETWSEASAGLISLDVRTLAVNSVNPGILYAGGFGGVFKSTDGGATWNGTGLTAYTGTLAAGAANVYALTGRSFGCDSSESVMFSSTDDGGNWSNTVSPLNSGCVLNAVFPSVHSIPIAIDPSDPNTLYLGESDEQDGYSAILKSTDRGANWRAAWDWFDGLRGSVRALAIDPTHSKILYAGIDDGSTAFALTRGSSAGLFRSTDGGASWSNTGLTASAVNLLAIDPANPQVIYAGVEGHYSQPAGFQGLFKSTDGGRNWQAINSGLAGLIGAGSTTATALTAGSADSPADSRILYLGTSSGGIFRSSDGGANWSPFNDGLTSLQIRALAIAPGPSRTVFAATAGGIFKYSDE